MTGGKLNVEFLFVHFKKLCKLQCEFALLTNILSVNFIVFDRREKKLVNENKK